MDDSYQLSPVNFPSECSPLPSPEEGRSVQRPKRWDKHGDKDEDNSPKNVNNVLINSFAEHFFRNFFTKFVLNRLNDNHLYHHHHVVPLARISLTLARHFSLSFIDSGRSSGLHPVSSQSCFMYVLAGRPAFARPYVGVHWSTSFMISSLLLQQCPACLVRLTWIFFVMGGRWPYSWFFVGCCRQDLFNIALNILV